MLSNAQALLVLAYQDKGPDGRVRLLAIAAGAQAQDVLSLLTVPQ